MAKSTHSGHCQACGRLQKLPHGLLAKHGYTVRAGFFSGVCRGSGKLPFEISCDQLPTYIAEADYALNGIITEQASLRQVATEPRGWVHNYERSATGRSSYVARYVEVFSKEHSYADRTWLTFHYLAPGWRQQGVEEKHDLSFGYGPNTPTTILEAATALNRQKAKEMEREVSSLLNYIAWQQERILTWAPAPLLPNTAKDNEGFKPEGV